ncbi:MAG: hypothetical protein HC913_18995 [Microscillaceae bacterium]|nr:hypothetical protein [Microscillaceae bacterium]
MRGYHLRQSFYVQDFALVEAYYQLLATLVRPGLLARLIRRLARLRLPLHGAYRVYLHLKKAARK